MRVLVVSTPRTCSSVATDLIATKFNLTNLHEIYSAWNSRMAPLGGPRPNARFNADRVFAARHGKDQPPWQLPDSLKFEDDYCGKLLTPIFLTSLSATEIDWTRIDKIVFTTRRDVVSQVASWLTLEALYAETKDDTPEVRMAKHPSFRGAVNLGRIPHVVQNFTKFRWVRCYVGAIIPERCVDITYEMFQAPNAAAQLSVATGWAFTPDDLKGLELQPNNKNYEQDITNYAELAAALKAHGIE